MLVAASTSCIPNTPLSGIFDKLADIEYAHAELVIGENEVISLATLESQFDSIVQVCRMTRRVTPVGIFLDVEPDYPDFTNTFSTVCALAKALKIVTVSIHGSLLGMPFNEEVERLNVLVKKAMPHGVVVALATEAGRMTETQESVALFCKYTKGLSVSFDPSHYVYKLPKPRDYDLITQLTAFVRLRDTTVNKFQSRVGQGVIDFGRIIMLLQNINYNGVLCVDLKPQHGIDTISELRKLRLLLESSL